ncbi:MAG: DUF4214 domain-containing protein, partial [Candidatus Omnitrophota bacterium]
YYFAVTAYNAYGESDYSKELSFVIKKNEDVPSPDEDAFTPQDDVPVPRDILISKYVEKYYYDILDREPDPGGADAWFAEIERTAAIGIDVKEGFISLARTFFTSAEYILREKDDFEYITDLYQTFLNRTPEQWELNAWAANLSDGLSRNVIFNSFAFSEEFSRYMANEFGEDSSLPEHILVNDLYRGFQNRMPDTDGFVYWVDLMQDAMSSGESPVRELSQQIALEFLQSEEYILCDKSDQEFLEDLYNGILCRGADKAEFDSWLDFITQGMTREEVLQEFTGSVEFQARVPRDI